MVKATFGATVVGNELKRPDPKNMPLTYVGVVKLEVGARATGADKPGKALLIVDVNEMTSHFGLGRKFRVTIEDTQQELQLGRGDEDAAEPEAGATPPEKPTGRGRRGRGGILSLPGTQERD